MSKYHYPWLRRLATPHLVVSVIILTQSGCMPRDMDLADMKAMMPPPAPQLAELNRLHGDWTTSGTIQFIAAKDPLTTTGSNSAAWECDGRFLVDRSTYDMGPLGKMSGINIWTWDAGSGCYRLWWFDGFGESARGTASFDAKEKAWHIRTRGTNGKCAVVSRGTIRHVDDNHLEWTWKQWDSWRIFKISEMSGTSTRKSANQSAGVSTSNDH